jgi:uncharacterized membrane protein
MLVEWLRWLHVVGATASFGTGAGIAFFMWMAHRTQDARLVAHVASTVVFADFLFTATAVVVQPVTGFALVALVGWPLTDGWMLLSLMLYVLTGAFWLPVVWIQMRMRDLAREAARQGASLPPGYQRLFRRWVALGGPAFASVLAILWLMVIKPQIKLF